MKSKQPQKNFKVLVSVDESRIFSQRGESKESTSLKEAIKNEFGWLYESGIYLKTISDSK